MRPTLLFVAAMLPLTLPAQDIKQALLRMQDIYRNTEKMHIVMTIRVAEDAASSPYFVEKADIKKDRENYRYHLGTHEMLFNEKYLIMVDHTEKEITLAKRDVKAETGSKDMFQMSIDTLLSFYDPPVYKGRTGNVDEYEFFHGDAEVTHTTVFIDATSGMLRKIAYKYKEGQVAVVDIPVFDNDPAFDAATFEEKPYFTVANEKIIPGASFRDYDLVRADEE